MLEVHHLNASRSRRITWLLEELGAEYRVFPYERDPATRYAPPALKAIHPLGKAPILRDGSRTLIESGAIVDYLIRHYGHGRFAPAAGSEDFERYQQFLHYAEGSAMLPLLLKLYVGRLGAAGAPLQPRIEAEIENHLGWLERELDGRDYFVGDSLTGADVQLSFVAQIGVQFCGAAPFPRLAAFAARIEARPAYRRAVERWGS